jgi:preprotein translocase subunit SecF
VGPVTVQFSTPSIDFMGPRKITGGLSLLVVFASVLLLFFNGLSFGLDFTGGSLVELQFFE